MVPVLEIMFREVLLHLRLHRRGRFAESVAIGGVFGRAPPQVVEQHAEFAEIVGVGDQQMDARPIEIGLRRRRAHGDVDAVHWNVEKNSIRPCSNAGGIWAVLDFRKRRVSAL